MEHIDWGRLLLEGLVAAAVFAVGVVAGGVLTAVLLVKLPTTYFCDSHVRDFWIERHPVLRWTARVLKNLTGAALIALGGLLSLPGVPGPGLLLIIVGITLLDVPGKRRFERWLVGRPRIFSSINRLRARYGKPPLVLDQNQAREEDRGA